MVHFVRRVWSSAVIWSAITTALRFGGVLLVLPIVLRTIPQAQLGLYYVFQTLGVFAVFLDMGFSPSLARSVSYLWAGAPTLQVSGHSHADGMAQPNWTLLKSVTETFRLFYWAASGVLLLFLLAFGMPYIWHVTATLDNPGEGRAIWIVLSIGAVWNFAGTIWPTMLSGINRVRDQQIVQLIAILTGYVVTVSGLLLGFGLWAMAASMIVQATIQRQCAHAIYLRVVSGHFGDSPGQRDWGIIKTLWPSSWKAGVISLSVTIYLSAPVFLTSTFLGLATAGQVGLCMQLSMTIAQIAVVAFLVKVPLLSILRVNKRYEELSRVFVRRTLVYVIIYFVGAVTVFLCGEWVLHTIIKSKTPLPSHAVLVLLLAFTGVDGFQSLFRSLANCANVVYFWKRFIVGVCIACMISTVAMQLGIISFLIVLILLKVVLIDIYVIRVGSKCLEASHFDTAEQG